MQLKKALITIPLVSLAALAFPGIVAAHNATATGTCQQGVSWSATAYDANVTNSIVVKVDGATVYQDASFGASDTGTFATVKTAPHTWQVVVNAPGTQFDKNLTGSYQACVVPPTTTVAATTTTPVTTVAPTTTTPQATTTIPVTTVATTVAPTTPPSPCDTSDTVASCFPPVPPTPTSVAGLGQDVAALTPAEPGLPRTGGGSPVLPIAALICIGVGVAGLFATRRKA